MRTNSNALLGLCSQDSASPTSRDVARQLIALRTQNTPEPKNVAIAQTLETSAQNRIADLRHIPADTLCGDTVSSTPFVFTDRYPEALAKVTCCIRDAITLRKSVCTERSCVEQRAEDTLSQHLWPFLCVARAQCLNRMSTAINERRSIQARPFLDHDSEADAKFILCKMSQKILERGKRHVLRQIAFDRSNKAVTRKVSHRHTFPVHAGT
jgi:hypothetical protein